LHGPYDPAAPAFYFKLSADKLHGGAEHRYAQLLSHGFGVSADPAQAAAYFKRASDHGITEADCDDGSGADTQTVDTLRRKAIAGDADAQCGFAVALLKGRGVPRDAEEVRAWLKVAADAGNTRAQILFAVTIGWPEAAKRWAALASGAGNTVAKFELWLNGWVE
jgi:TPR repeat protein